MSIHAAAEQGTNGAQERTGSSRAAHAVLGGVAAIPTVVFAAEAAQAAATGIEAVSQGASILPELVVHGGGAAALALGALAFGYMTAKSVWLAIRPGQSRS